MSGYVHCACRDCFAIDFIGEPGDFCEECVEAGCHENPKIGRCMLCDDGGFIGRSDDLTGGKPCEVCGPGQHECLREDAYSDDLEGFSVPTCPACGSYGEPLGTLGQLDHFRCRGCGMDFHRQTVSSGGADASKEVDTP